MSFGLVMSATTTGNVPGSLGQLAQLVGGTRGWDELNPSAAIAIAVARPIPKLAPVITAIFPFNVIEQANSG